MGLIDDTPTKEDILSRKAFARALVDRIKRYYDNKKEKARKEGSKYEPSAFLIHIHGQWGSGKSTLLEFMQDQLEKLEKESESSLQWIAIKFNAWQNQNIGPPWWSLMDAVYKQATSKLWERKHKLLLYLRFREHCWRFKTRRSFFFWLAAIIIFAFISLILLLNPFNILSTLGTVNPSISETSHPNIYSIIAGIISLIISVFSVVQGLRSFLPGSEQSAREFVRLTSDPMLNLQHHFTDLIKLIKHPIVILIDDLDRCKDTYTVEFLDGVQTLFRNADVVFIIAADRRWIGTSYENVYNNFLTTIEESGRPLGSVFLDKIFQISTSMPAISAEAQEQYLKYLVNRTGKDYSCNKLSSKEQESAKLEENIKEEIKTKMLQLKTEEEILKELQQAITKRLSDEKYYNGTKNYEVYSNELYQTLYAKILRETAVARLASQEVDEHTGYELERSGLGIHLEPNPRAMKRFVMAYGISRANNILSAHCILERRTLALWTIIKLRWPMLAKYLQSHPEMIEYMRRVDIFDINAISKNLDLTGVPNDLQNLFRDTNVVNVVKDMCCGARLDEYALKAISAI